MGVSLKKQFFRETPFHNASCDDNLIPLHHCIVVLLFNGNSMCYGLFASKLTENSVFLHHNFSLSDCHLSLIFLEGEVTCAYCHEQA